MMTIRRNADGQQNLRDLRKALAASEHSVYRQGDTWIVSQWSETHGANMVAPAPYWYDERNAVQKALGMEVEPASEAAMYVRQLHTTNPVPHFAGRETNLEPETMTMMNYYEAQNASLDELSAAGWDSTQATRREALAAVVALIADTSPNSLPEAYHTGFAAAEAGDSECPYPAGSDDAEAWAFGYAAV